MQHCHIGSRNRQTGGNYKLRSENWIWPLKNARHPPLCSRVREFGGALAKLAGLGQQAEDQVSVVGEIVEVTGVNQHRSLAQQINGQVFVGSSYGDTQYGIPSPFRLQALARLFAAQLTVEPASFMRMRSRSRGWIFSLLQQVGAANWMGAFIDK